MPGLKTLMEKEDSCTHQESFVYKLFQWEVREKDGYRVLSDTPCIKRRNVSVLGEHRCRRRSHGLLASL